MIKKLTVDLDSDLHHQLKLKALAQRTTMSDLVRQWVKEFIENCDKENPGQSDED